MCWFVRDSEKLFEHKNNMILRNSNKSYFQKFSEIRKTQKIYLKKKNYEVVKVEVSTFYLMGNW